MKDSSINEGFHDRIEFAEELFQRSQDYEALLQEWQGITYTIQKLLKEHGARKTGWRFLRALCKNTTRSLLLKKALKV